MTSGKNKFVSLIILSFGVLVVLFTAYSLLSLSNNPLTNRNSGNFEEQALDTALDINNLNIGVVRVNTDDYSSKATHVLEKDGRNLYYLTATDDKLELAENSTVQIEGTLVKENLPLPLINVMYVNFK